MSPPPNPRVTVRKLWMSVNQAREAAAAAALELGAIDDPAELIKAVAWARRSRS